MGAGGNRMVPAAHEGVQWEPLHRKRSGSRKLAPRKLECSRRLGHSWTEARFREVVREMSSHDHAAPPSPLAARVKALEAILVEKGLVDPAALDLLVDTYENKVGPHNGAKIV